MSAASSITAWSPALSISEDEGLKRRLAEKAKYEKMWQHAEYRQVAPGEEAAGIFLTQARPRPGSEVTDFGTGTGRGALSLAVFGQCKVRMLDFAENCLDEDVQNALTTQAHVLSFQVHDLNRPISTPTQYGYCTDVMEHIPPEDVDRVLRNVLHGAQHVFFQISCTDDVCGALIGEPLHLSVHPYAWWLEKFREYDCVIHWSADYGTHAMFYVSAWSDGDDLVKRGVSNTDEETIKEQVLTNIKAGWAQIEPHMTNDVELMVLGGGPSLNAHLDEIREWRKKGGKLITLNGAYNWALENDLIPSATIVVDARQFNSRFTHPIVDDCKYLIASQCHPEVLEGLPKDRTLLWHTSAEFIRDILTEHYETWWAVPGGSTVMLRALPLLRMLGFTKFHLYGFDSCLSDDEHHAFSQLENDGDMVIPTIVGGRRFRCHPWMVSQAQEFMDLIKVLGDEMEIRVAGDGLIAHILQTGSELIEE